MSGADYSVSNYGIFSDAVTTTGTLITDVGTSVEAITKSKTTLSDESVFMGPIADSCKEALDASNTRLSNLTTNCNAYKDYFIETANTYQSGDKKAAKFLSFSNGQLGLTTSANSGVQTGKTNQDTIYNYLSQQGFNDAAISGILANIQHESNFSPTALGDGGTSYGICQWHNSRWDRLDNYCRENNLDVNSVEGQTNYLVWELQNYYPSVYEKIKNVPNTSQGAYDAAYEWTVHFEIPQNAEASGQNRGNTAVESYWPTYSNNTVNT